VRIYRAYMVFYVPKNKGYEQLVKEAMRNKIFIIFCCGGDGGEDEYRIDTREKYEKFKKAVEELGLQYEYAGVVVIEDSKEVREGELERQYLILEPEYGEEKGLDVVERLNTVFDDVHEIMRDFKAGEELADIYYEKLRKIAEITKEYLEDGDDDDCDC